MNRKKPELLIPASSLEVLKTAVRYGADAVYIGDTQGDADACKEADVPFVFAEYGFGTVKEADNTIQAFSDLLSLFPADSL